MKAKERLAETDFNLRYSMTLQKHLSSQVLQHHQLNVADNPVTYDGKSYTKNTLGDKLEVPECVKVLGVKWVINLCVTAVLSFMMSLS